MKDAGKDYYKPAIITRMYKIRLDTLLADQQQVAWCVVLL